MNFLYFNHSSAGRKTDTVYPDPATLPPHAKTRPDEKIQTGFSLILSCRFRNRPPVISRKTTRDLRVWNDLKNVT